MWEKSEDQFIYLESCFMTGDKAAGKNPSCYKKRRLQKPACGWVEEKPFLSVGPSDNPAGVRSAPPRAWSEAPAQGPVGARRQLRSQRDCGSGRSSVPPTSRVIPGASVSGGRPESFSSVRRRVGGASPAFGSGQARGQGLLTQVLRDTAAARPCGGGATVMKVTGPQGGDKGRKQPRGSRGGAA